VPESVTALQTTNWWGIVAATVALAMFVSVYGVYRSLWAGRKYRKQGAAPSAGKNTLGGRRWWGERIEILPFFVALLYLGIVSAFIGRTWATILSVWWLSSAIAVAGVFWLIPFYIKTKSAAEECERQKTREDQSPGDYPGGDDADYVVVSPYEPVDSDQRPWWKRRRRE
jgi:hypothetical protein